MRQPLWKVRVEISNYCNLKCPHCIRPRIEDTYNLNSKHVELNDIKKWLPHSFLMLKTHKEVYLSGAVAEPTLNPYCIDICKYLLKSCSVTIDSNGSTNNEDWWHTLGRTECSCVFGIDSIKPRNNIYRVNSNTEKVISNIKAFVAGGGKATWKYIPFEHNEDELEDQKKIAKSIGCSFSMVQPYAFDPNSEGQKMRPSKYFYDSKNLVDDYTKKSSPHHYCKIIGETDNLIEIGPDGIVYPCCYSARDFFRVYSNYFNFDDPTPNIESKWMLDEKHKRFVLDVVPLIESQGGVKSLSLYHNKIETVLSSKLFQSTLKQSWENGNEYCLKHCTSRKYVFENT